MYTTEKLRVICVAVILCAFAASAGALTISIEPGQVHPGDVVTIAVEGLDDGRSFGLQLEGTFAVAPGGGFTFETLDLVLPFTLQNGTFAATLRNTDRNVLTVLKGDTEVKKMGASRNGVFSAVDSGTIPSGTYDYIRFEGTAAPDATVVSASVTLQGTKQGPRDSRITFSVGGVTGGTVLARVSADGAEVISRTISISETATPAPTATATTLPASGGGGGGGGGGSGGIAGDGISTGAKATTSPPATAATPADTVPAAENLSHQPAATGVVNTAVPAETPPGETAPAPSPQPILAPLLPALAVAACAIAALASFRRR